MYPLDTMRSLANQGELVNLKTGEMLFRASEKGFTMFGILEGSVRLTWNDNSGHKGHEDIPAGNVFGAGALLRRNHKRFGTAIAIQDSRLIEMTREKFLFAIQESPMFAIELLASIDKRMRDIKLTIN